MTTLVNLTRAEFRKLVAARTFLIGLALSVGLAVISVVAQAASAGKNGHPALATSVGADSLLKLGVVCCVAMLVLGILGSGGEYRHKTIIPAMLVTPRRGALVAAKVIGIAIAGAILSAVTFGTGLATTAAELSAHGIHHLPAATASMFAGAVITGILFGVIGVALGYITRSTVAAVVGAVAWVMFIEQVILRALAPAQLKWLVSGTAQILTTPVEHGSTAPLTPATATAVLSAYALVLLAGAARLVVRRDVA
jgi:ABC-type transport system involved in multi-copper enzyme maturation permease subunit